MVSLQTAVPWEAALENLWTLKHPSSAAERVAEIVLVFIFYWALHFTASFALRQWLLGHRYYSKLSYEKQCLAAEK